MASHVDHTEHDVSVIVTEQGLADLRGLTRASAQVLIDNCAHPISARSCRITSTVPAASYGKHTRICCRKRCRGTSAGWIRNDEGLTPGPDIG